MSIIVIRLHPEKPTSGNSFKDYLTGLEIKITERSFAHPKGSEAGATVLGTAKFLTEGDPNATIVQHWSLGPLPPPGRLPVATAAVLVASPFPFKEYDNPDLRLTITRGTQVVLNQDVNFNVGLAPGPLPAANPMSYAALTPVSLYLALPRGPVGLGPGVAYVEVPENGTPPSFQAVYGAVKLVLQKDPQPPTAAGLDVLMRSLTAQQARHIAEEIVNNRVLDPLPVPPKPLEEMYSGSAETERRQFESDLQTYYTVHNTRAEVLARFIFAMSAALAANQMTTDAKQVGFSFPILPGLPPNGEKVVKKTVVISQ